jgi:hypothetical protein
MGQDKINFRTAVYIYKKQVYFCDISVLYRADYSRLSGSESKQTAEKFWCQTYGET